MKKFLIRVFVSPLVFAAMIVGRIIGSFEGMCYRGKMRRFAR